jgi:photosystem II stability/assembly factor-like uncharacterized protein
MNAKRFAITVTLSLLGLILALLSGQAVTSGQGLPATPAGAEEWTPLGGPAVEGGQVNALAVHPAIANTVYAAVAPVGAYDSGPSTIYKTTDGAASWTPVYVAEHQVYALGVTGTHVYAGAVKQGGEGASIYASHDSGLTWTPAYTTNDRGVWLDIALHPADADVAIIGGWHYHQAGGERVQSGLVYRTDDAGMTWTPILTVTYPDVEGQVSTVLIHPVTPTLLYASAKADGSPDSAIYRSEDGGATWPVSITISGAHVMSLLADTSDPPMLYAGTGQGQWTGGPSKVFRSTDAGLTWDEVSSDAGGLLVFEPPSTVYAGPDPLWASTANGDPGTWTLVQDFAPGPQYSFAIDLGPSPAALYRGGAFSGVNKSTDGGVDWTGASNGIGTLVTPVDIATDPQTLGKLFVAGECQGDGGWMSTDGGESWTVPSGLRSCIMSFAVNPQDPDIVYAGAMSPNSGSVLRSEDGGLTFRPVYTATYILPDGSGGQQAILDLAVAPSRPDTVYAAGQDQPNGEERHAVVVRSLDGGVSWTEVFTLPPISGISALAVDPLDDAVVYAATEGMGQRARVFRTADSGVSWTQVFTGSYSTVSSIVVNYWNPDVIYLAAEDVNVHKSTDGGDTWELIRTCCPSGYLLAIDPNLPSHVYLGGWGYIAETADGGATWSEWDDLLNQGTPEMDPGALAVDHGTVTQTLYGGWNGLWAHSRPAPQPWRVYLPLVLRSYTP